MFGKFSEGFRSLRPYLWKNLERPLIEIPVTTMPLAKVPIHLSYLLYLGQYSPAVAAAYFRLALVLCKITRIEPSILLHPLDFLGCDDERNLSFFPVMGMPAAKKLAIAERALDQLTASYEVVTMSQHAAAIRQRLGAPSPATPVNVSAPQPVQA